MTEPAESTRPRQPSVTEIYQEPGVRNYLAIGVAALGMIFLLMLARDALVGGVLCLILGVAGLLLRWSAIPAVLLMTLTYFLIFPEGEPLAYENSGGLDRGGFRIPDLILTFSVLIYLACQFRVLGHVLRTFPDEHHLNLRDQAALRRPPTAIVAGEIVRLICVGFGVVIAGQMLWWLLTNLEVDAGGRFPITIANASRWMRRSDGFSLAATRFLLLIGIALIATTVCRVVFAYWGWRRATALQARMVLLDADWDETRRERTRVEVWRLWRRRKPTPIPEPPPDRLVSLPSRASRR